MIRISANTGIGSFLLLASSKRANPPARDPVKPTAFTGLVTMMPTVRPSPKTRKRIPLASYISAYTPLTNQRAVPGCEYKATITGQPAASAEAVSPPQKKPRENYCTKYCDWSIGRRRSKVRLGQRLSCIPAHRCGHPPSALLPPF